MLQRQRSWLGLWVLLCLTMATGIRAQDQDSSNTKLWEDFNHYVLVARPDLAQTAGAALLAKVTDAQLLDTVEQDMRQVSDYQATLDRAMKIDQLKDLAVQFTNRIQAARIARSRDPARIANDIQTLDKGERPYTNAVARLGAAGQYAAPALLAVLLDDSQSKLHPYVLDAMIQIGEPLVAPLSVAVVSLEPVPQGQIAHVLADIGYPRALPALQSIIENPKTDPTARQIVQTAFVQLANSVNLNPKVSAAALYLELAQNFYAKGTKDASHMPDVDAATNGGLIWTYTNNAGLQFVTVPSEIFGDVEAMGAAVSALKLNPNLDQALSTWLMANLRRANRLPAGKTDPSYGASMLSPIFYARAAGPLRLHDVLARALADSDSRLALDAISCLGATAGTDALVNRKGVGQPLIQALYYPDRRVRFDAAFTLTNARPKAKFPGSDHVVPVLAEAVRQSDQRYAVVIGSDQDSANRLVGIMKSLKYEAISATSLTEAIEALPQVPGVDLIVTNLESDQVRGLVAQTASNYKLAGAPILVLTTPGNQVALNERYGALGRVHSALASADAAALTAAVDQTIQANLGKPIDAKEALDYTARALGLLAAVAVEAGDVFNVADAQPALLNALNDARPGVPVLAAQVLDKITNEQAQQAIADAAFDTARPEPIRIALLNAASESATLFGNHLNPVQIDQVLKLVTTSTGDLSIAAARLQGALTLPTADIKQMITK